MGERLAGVWDVTEKRQELRFGDDWTPSFYLLVCLFVLFYLANAERKGKA